MYVVLTLELSQKSEKSERLECQQRNELLLKYFRQRNVSGRIWTLRKKNEETAFFWPHLRIEKLVFSLRVRKTRNTGKRSGLGRWKSKECCTVLLL